MIDAGKIVEGFSGKLGERWFDALFTPALFFWVSGAAAWASGPSFHAANGSRLEATVLRLPGSDQLLLAIVALGIVLGSSALAERFTLPLLRCFAGAWPAWAQPLADLFSARFDERYRALSERFQTLSRLKDAGTMSRAELAALVDVERRLAEISPEPAYRAPTAIGNVLRAAERLPAERYGLDATVCFSRLWLTMPDSTRSELADARERLNASARLTFWSFALAVWTALAWVALPLAALLVWYGYRSMLRDARAYGALFVAAFDVDRRSLYAAVGWPYPATAATEKHAGELLTDYLRRGDDDPRITFVNKD